ncbi:MAG: ATP-binding protein [Candidatus Marinimicrobia bacterium]|nr:ATP-binding protein [Candidatus Neomarinimicrobiota bacterium]
MKILKRAIEKSILNNLQSNKVVVILGARRTGKTILLKQIIEKLDEPYLLLNGEDQNSADILSIRTVKNYKNILGDKRVLIIDEAQKIENIGQILKLMIDEISGLKIIITGSSIFDISNKIGEPLVGRKWTYHLYPIFESEYNQIENRIEKIDNLRERLIFGNYPELMHIPNRERKKQYLQEIINSYLLKDILTFENLRNSSKIQNLLRLVARQIGKKVSYHELGKQLSMSKNTVERYLDLLSKVFILYRVDGFSRNLRKEISKSSKWYFYDNGIRNVLINNLNQLELRNDVGALWENYIISERIKFQQYNRMLVGNYFWQTYDQQEIDWIEDRDGKLFAYEMKWKKVNVKIPTAWKKAYPESKFSIINKENYGDWVL